MSGNFKYTRQMKRDPDQNARIACEYCGSVIDIDTDGHCPNCGTPYSKNAQLQQLRNQQMESKKLKMESEKLEIAERRAAMNRMQQLHAVLKKLTRFIRLGCLIPAVVTVIIFAVLFATGVYLFIEGELRDQPTQPTQTTQAQIIETPTEVGFNESAEMIQYSVICDKMEEYHYPWSDPKAGFYYVKLHLIVTNTSDKKLRIPGEMLCQYEKDGYMLQAEVNTIRSEDLGTKIYNTVVFPGSSAEGWVYFEVPLDTDLILKYDEYVTINIGAENCVMPEDGF